MNKLSAFSKNPFFTIKSSKDSIQQFAFDHIQRLKAASNPNYAGLITDTELLWTKVFGSLQTYDSQSNLRQSLTIQTKDLIRQFTSKALELESYVVFTFKKKSGIYQEFFPYLRSEFHHIKHDNVMILMERMVSVCHTYSTQIGSSWETTFTDLRDNFKTVFASQKTSKGGVSEIIPDYSLKLKDLSIQLYKNLAAIMMENPSNPKIISTFFDETIVNFAKRAPKKEKE